MKNFTISDKLWQKLLDLEYYEEIEIETQIKDLDGKPLKIYVSRVSPQVLRIYDKKQITEICDQYLVDLENMDLIYLLNENTAMMSNTDEVSAVSGQDEIEDKLFDFYIALAKLVGYLSLLSFTDKE